MKSLKQRARSAAVRTYPWNHNKDCTASFVCETGWLMGYQAAKRDLRRKLLGNRLGLKASDFLKGR